MARTTKLSRKYLSKTLAELSAKKTFGVNVTESVQAWDVQWGGGTKNDYRLYNLNDGTLVSMSPQECELLAVPVGKAIVVTGYFCGQPSGVSVNLNDQDVPAFFGATGVPEGMPGKVAADWLDETAENFPARVGKRRVQAAELTRQVCQ